jgi:hypothetical protein
MTYTIYDSLELREGETRLIKLHPAGSSFAPIQCTLLKMQLDSPPAYEALSYVWGGPNATKTVTVSGIAFNATENLHDALLHLRYPDKERVLWVDAICINQSSTRERNSQVLLMRRIYERAARVQVCLGIPGLTGELGMGLILRVGYESDQMKERHESQDLTECCTRLWSLGSEAWDAMKEILTRVYWTRVWVYQEFIVSKDVTLFCGSEYMSGEAFRRAIMLLLQFQSNPSTTEPVRDQMLQLDLTRVLPFFSHWFRRQIKTHSSTATTGLDLETFDLPLLILQTQSLESTDPRDKIYGLLGVSESGNVKIEVDYAKRIPEVYCDVQRSIFLARRQLPLLSYAGIGIPVVEPPLDLPSWAMDLRCSPGRNDFTYFLRQSKVSQQTVFSASGATDAVADFTEPGILRAEGVVASTLREVSFDGGIDLEAWRKFAFKGRQDPQHPTGIPLWQAYFRTLIADDSGYGYGRPEFRDEKDAKKFYDLAKGFIMMGWMGSPQWQEMDSLYYLIYGIGHNRPQVVLEDYAVAFSSWRGELAREDTSFSEALEPFTGRRGAKNRLPWPRTGPLRTDKWYSYLERDRSDFHEAFHRVHSVCKSKSFFVTNDGYIGLGPPGATTGDRICVVLGCDVPLVIRPAGSRFVVVGACYVYGMMKGELVQEARERRGDWKIEMLEFR